MAEERTSAIGDVSCGCELLAPYDSVPDYEVDTRLLGGVEVDPVYFVTGPDPAFGHLDRTDRRAADPAPCGRHGRRCGAAELDDLGALEAVVHACSSTTGARTRG